MVDILHLCVDEPFGARHSQSFAGYGRVLCSDDLPLSVALQPGVSPDEAAWAFLSIVGFTHGAFTAVDHSEIVAEVANLGVVQLTANDPTRNCRLRWLGVPSSNGSQEIITKANSLGSDVMGRKLEVHFHSAESAKVWR